MPVAIATGFCLERLRKQAGLDPAVDPRGGVMVGVRANDPLEQELIDQSGIEILDTFTDLASNQRSGVTSYSVSFSASIDTKMIQNY
jgi:hypothetical protein